MRGAVCYYCNYRYNDANCLKLLYTIFLYVDPQTIDLHIDLTLLFIRRLIEIFKLAGQQTSLETCCYMFYKTRGFLIFRKMLN